MAQEDQQKGGPNAAKRLARLVAVQALYQASYEQEDIGEIISNSLTQAAEFLNSDEGAEPRITQKPDGELVSQIVRGVLENSESIEAMVSGALDQKVSSGRMEILLKTIIRAGVYELHHHADIASGIIISDYVDVSRAFFNGKEPGLVNAVLDRLSKVVRS